MLPATEKRLREHAQHLPIAREVLAYIELLRGTNEILRESLKSTQRERDVARQDAHSHGRALCAYAAALSSAGLEPSARHESVRALDRQRREMRDERDAALATLDALRGAAHRALRQHGADAPTILEGIALLVKQRDDAREDAAEIDDVLADAGNAGQTNTRADRVRLLVKQRDDAVRDASLRRLAAEESRRWEDGMRSVATLIVGARVPFEIAAVVDRVRVMKERDATVAALFERTHTITCDACDATVCSDETGDENARGLRETAAGLGWIRRRRPRPSTLFDDVCPACVTPLEAL